VRRAGHHGFTFGWAQEHLAGLAEWVGLKHTARFGHFGAGRCAKEPGEALPGSPGHSESAVGRDTGEDGLSSGRLAQTAALRRPAHHGNGMGRQAVLRVLRSEVRLAAHSPGLVAVAGGPLRWGTRSPQKTRSKSGKPRRASGGVVRQRNTATTDSPTDRSLEVGRLRAATTGGHARAVTQRQLSVEGNALEGLAPREWDRSDAGMRARNQQPGEPHGRQGDATSSRCLRWRNPSRWCETTRTAHVRRLAALGRSRLRSAGGRAEGEHDRGADTTRLGARWVATSAVWHEMRFRLRKARDVAGSRRLRSKGARSQGMVDAPTPTQGQDVDLQGRPTTWNPANAEVQRFFENRPTHLAPEARGHALTPVRAHCAGT
jgi:hypothetical protein